MNIFPSFEFKGRNDWTGCSDEITGKKITGSKKSSNIFER